MENNTIQLKDCIEGIKELEDGSVDLVVTDPPYYFPQHLNRKSNNTTSKFALSPLYINGGAVIEDLNYFDEKKVNEFLDLLPRVMKKMNGYFCCAEQQVPFYVNWATRNKFCFTILMWEKPLSIINKNRFSQNVEFIIRIYTNKVKTGLNAVDEFELYNKVCHDEPISGANKLHLTQKPISLMEKFIKLSSQEGDVILDPFMGSATTAIACLNLKRNYIGFEKNEEYYKVAQKRIENWHREPTLF